MNPGTFLLDVAAFAVAGFLLLCLAKWLGS
jgi:hypothetical protein